MKFKIGDKVKAVNDDPKEYIGIIKKISEYDSYYCKFLVKFKGFRGHDGGINDPDNECWFCLESDIELIKPTKPIDIFDDYIRDIESKKL